MASASNVHVSGFQQLRNYFSKGEAEEQFISDIHKAASHGDKEWLEELLADGDLDVNLRDEIGNSALHIALEKKHNNLVELLLKNGLSANAKSDQGNIPLHLCTDVTAAKSLIEYGSSINIKNIRGETPLHRCTHRKSISLMEYLLRSGADVDARNKDGETALMSLSTTCFSATPKYMLQILLSFGADINVKDAALKTPLHHACQNAMVEMVQLLIDNGAKLDVRDRAGRCPIHYCLNNCLWEGNSLLEMLNILLPTKEAANIVDTRGRTILHIASLDKSQPIVEIILNHGANVRQSDYQGKTPLHYAAINKDYGASLIVSLMKKGCNVNSCDHWGQTPLHEGIANENLNFIKGLLSEGKCDIEKADITGITPLHVASTKYNISLVKCLLDSKANVNVVDDNNSTPLHFAAWADADKVADELINNGSNINIKDKRGQTALDVARFRRATDTIKILTKYVINTREVEQFSNIANKQLDYETVSDMLKEKGNILRTDENLQNYLGSILGNSFVGRGTDDDEDKEIQLCIEEFVQSLGKTVSNYDKTLKCTVLHAGRASEGTKTKGPDEFDFLFCLENLSNHVNFSFTKDYLKPFLVLAAPIVPDIKAVTFEYEDFKEMTVSVSDYLRISLKDDDEALSFVGITGSREIPCYDMFNYFGEIIETLVFGKDFPKHSKLLPVEVTVNPDLRLRWRGCKYKELMIDLDLVPAVFLPSWSDKYEKDLALVTPDISGITCVAVPKMTADHDDDLWRSSLALVETAIFRKLRPNVRNSYTVCKAMISSAILPHINFGNYELEKYAFKREHQSVSSEELENISFYEIPEQIIPSYILKMIFFSVVDDIVKKHGIDSVYGKKNNSETGLVDKTELFVEEAVIQLATNLPTAESHDSHGSKDVFYGPAVDMFNVKKTIDIDADIVKEVFTRCLEAISTRYVPSYFNPHQNVLGARLISEDAYKVETYLKIINELIAE